MFKINIDKLDLIIKQAQELDEDPIKRTIKDALKSNCTLNIEFNGDQWTGSGFHIGDGYIGTVSHVVPEDMINQDYKLQITFDGQNFFDGKIIVSESDTDTAIIKSIQPINDIPTVKLGDSDKAEVGDIIAVIGSPEGWHDTATVGRISNIKQNLGEDAPTPAWNDMIFIDADILQGSSGAMVINTRGEVVSVVMGVTGQHAEIGIGQNASIPINKLKKLLNPL